MIIQTVYRCLKPKYPLLIICPHDSDGQTFFSHFADIWKNEQVQKNHELFCRYLRIEQDFGAASLAHALAKAVQRRFAGLETTVLQLDYPRALLDGGRQEASCLRSCLPESLFADLREPLLRIHRHSLALVRAEVRRVAAASGVFLDLHTMAPHTPKCFDRKQGQLDLSFAGLADYVSSYTDPLLAGPERAIDLITEDQSADMLADPHLSQLLFGALSPHYPVVFNQPYIAQSHYMMHEYLKTCRGIAVDVPKHFLAAAPSPERPWCLYDFALCPTKIAALAKVLAEAVGRFFALAPLAGSLGS